MGIPLLGIDPVCLLLAIISNSTDVECQRNTSDQGAAQAVLDEFNSKGQEVFSKSSNAAWNYFINATEHNRQVMIDEELKSLLFGGEYSRKLSIYNTTNFPELMKREIEKLTTVMQTDSELKLKHLKLIKAEMTRAQSTAMNCHREPTKECIPVELDTSKWATRSPNYNDLIKVWVGWKDIFANKLKDLYPKFVSLWRDVAAESGEPDVMETFRIAYEMDNFEDEVKRLYDELLPLYQHLHAYCRKKLQAKYGAEKFPTSGHLPEHLFGGSVPVMWTALLSDVMPFKDTGLMNVDREMTNQGYTAEKIFKTAEEFFNSLGLIPMPEKFWEKSMLEKPTDGRDVFCHPLAMDFRNGKDFRIKMCTIVTQGSLISAHHEMGHVEYFLQYKHLPLAFREGANPGFHEAIGDVISLSVQTPEYMNKIGLLKKIHNDNESDINFLLKMALVEIVVLPFAYMTELWRWHVMQGKIEQRDYNKHWWNLKCKYQGLSAPVTRTANDFDMGSIHHIAGDVPIIRYFISYIIKYQIHKALCKAAGNMKPLHRCNIHGSKEAGKVLADVLKLGSSKPWPFAMEKLTGIKTMSSKPMLEYYEPLLKFLKKEIGDVDIGWKNECPNTVTLEEAISLGHLVTPSIIAISFVTLSTIISNVA